MFPFVTLPPVGVTSETAKSDPVNMASNAQSDTREAEMAAALQQQAAAQSSAREAMRFSASQAAINRSWQENMSNTAYQRAVKDLKAAGLNPSLAYSQGGASTPGGSAASGSVASHSKASVDSSTVREVLVRLLANESAAYQADTSSEAQKYSANVNALSRVFSNLLELFSD